MERSKWHRPDARRFVERTFQGERRRRLSAEGPPAEPNGSGRRLRPDAEACGASSAERPRRQRSGEGAPENGHVETRDRMEDHLLAEHVLFGCPAAGSRGRQIGQRRQGKWLKPPSQKRSNAHVNDPRQDPRPVDSRAANTELRDYLERRPLVPPAHEAELEPIPEERRILAILGEARRKGRWLVPRLLRVRAFFADVKVDLRDNPIPQDFTLDVGAFAAAVTLIVPPGV